MAGIYIHIPFCVQRCTYCDFYSETNIQNLNQFIHSLFKEIDERSEFWKKYTYQSIYFGGGTPSVLNDVQINKIIAYLKENFLVTNDAEVTLEANPEDLSNQYLNQLSETDVNRLSVEIQSFNDEILSFMNRRHDSKQAIDCIINAEKVGFKNISTDLIYGILGLTK